MPRSRLPNKKDGNHDAIKKDLQQCGCLVIDTASAGMSLDMFVCRWGTWLAVEIKNPDEMSKAQMETPSLALTSSEEKLYGKMLDHEAPYIIAMNSKEILDYFLRKERR